MTLLRSAHCMLVVLALCIGCASEPAYEWHLPAGYPLPPVPTDNPLTQAKVELGRHLFYDRRLSGNGTQSCGTCHLQALAFTDGRGTALGSTGEQHFRNTQGLTNAAYASSLTWANPGVVRLERQVLLPMFGERPVELGLTGKDQQAFEALRNDGRYRTLFARAFHGPDTQMDLHAITQALACFVRTIVSYRSPYDRYVYGHDASALSSSALRGMELFFSERTECFHCHNGFNFSDATVHEGSSVETTSFHHNGLYDEDGQGSYPALDQGLYGLTHRPADRGRFRAPSLRNVALTAPYMHDGSLQTLDEVLDHYARGGRLGAHGDGKKSVLKSPFVRGFILSDRERADLLAFLESLSDHELLKDRSLADPWSTP